MNLKKCLITLLDYQEIKILFHVQKSGDNSINLNEGTAFFDSDHQSCVAYLHLDIEGPDRGEPQIIDLIHYHTNNCNTEFKEMMKMKNQ